MNRLTLRQGQGFVIGFFLLFYLMIGVDYAQAAVITVDSVGDTVAADGECTFRGALTNANDDAGTDPDCVAGAGADTIEFNIAGAGVHTITVDTDSPLPSITGPVTIDGTTQSGASCGTLADLSDRNLLIEISGDVGTVNNGQMFSFGIGSAGSSLKGIASYYSYQPVVFSGDGDYSLTCTHIGVDATGTVLYGSRRNGIHVGGSGGTITIGGANPADKNIVSGVGVWNSQSTPQGILLQSQSDVIIQGNIIGSDITQSLDFGNTYSGISITSGLSAGASYQIGGTGEGEGNSILGNNSYGLSIESNNAVSTIIEGNTFSLAADGVTSIRNNTANILVRFPENLVRIGSAIEGGGNILGGTTYGILVWRSLPSVPVEIYGNYIGTDITGTIANQLTSRGIYLNATSSGSGDIDGVIIGGPNPGEGNVIAPGSTASIYGLANGADNIRNVTIEGNNIGIGPDGVTPITNFFSTYGIRMNVQGGSTIRLGGTTAGSENVISGHTNGGIFVENGDMTVLRNRVFDNDERGMLLYISN